MEQEMSLTRKHFFALARLCADERLNHDQTHAIAEFCKTFNRNFKKQRFYDAIQTHKDLMAEETTHMQARLERQKNG